MTAVLIAFLFGAALAVARVGAGVYVAWLMLRDRRRTRDLREVYPPRPWPHDPVRQHYGIR